MTSSRKGISIDPFFESSSKLLVAVGNAKRLQMLKLISGTESRVTNIADTLGLSIPSASHHLSILRRAKLVKNRRDAQEMYYICTSAKVERILATLEELFGVP